jgi:hypothetical protein
MQQGYTKYHCSFTTRNIPVYVKKTQRHTFTPENMNISCEPLVNPQDVCLPLLHITVRLIKTFVKALDRQGQALAYLSNKFPKLSKARMKVGILICPQVWEIMQDLNFPRTLSDTEKAAWNAFKLVCTNFLGNHKAENYREIVSEMLKCFQVMQCNMSLKLHCLDLPGPFPSKHGRT